SAERGDIGGARHASARCSIASALVGLEGRDNRDGQEGRALVFPSCLSSPSCLSCPVQCPPVTKYGRSPWLDQFPKSRVPSYPRHRGSMRADVVIVGGGLTGCATAYACAASGVKVLLLEADRIGHGATAAASGWIATEPGVPFARLEAAVGLRSARRAWHAWRR